MLRHTYECNKDDIDILLLLGADGLSETDCFVRFWDKLGYIFRVAFVVQDG